MNETDTASTSGHRARLRTRFLEDGEDALLEHELVEYLLTVTNARADTKSMAKRLLTQFGGFVPLLDADVGTLRAEGVSDAQIGALKIAAATARKLLEQKAREDDILSSWDALLDYLHAKMAWRGTEEVRALFLDTKNRLIANERLWEGTVDESAVHVREVMARALQLKAAALILVHNHPSGDPTPSRADKAITRDLVEAGRVLRIAVHDHVIVGGARPLSFRQQGLL